MNPRAAKKSKKKNRSFTDSTATNCCAPPINTGKHQEEKKQQGEPNIRASSLNNSSLVSLKRLARASLHLRYLVVAGRNNRSNSIQPKIAGIFPPFVYF